MIAQGDAERKAGEEPDDVSDVGDVRDMNQGLGVETLPKIDIVVSHRR
ncbi:MAG: hypothetical protein ACREPG_02060 [Candidatus Binatia bacterium]